MYTKTKTIGLLAAILGFFMALFFLIPAAPAEAEQCSMETQCVGGYVDSCFPVIIWVPFIGEMNLGDMCVSEWNSCVSQEQVQVCTEAPAPVAGGWYGAQSFDDSRMPSGWGCEYVEQTNSGQSICFGGYFPEPEPEPTPTPVPPPPPVVTFAPSCGSITNSCGQTITGVVGADGSCYYDAGSCPAPQAPTCANGADNYPTCTFPVTPPPPTTPAVTTCANGASNYPTCTFPVTPIAPVPSDPESESSPSGSAGPSACGGATISDCALNGVGHGGSSGSCTNGTNGTCRYTCLDGTWNEVNNSCSMVPALPPEITAVPRIVEMGGNTTLTVKTNGHMGCNVTGGVAPRSIEGAGDSFSVPVHANTTFTVSCALGSDSVIVEIVPIGYET